MEKTKEFNLKEKIRHDAGVTLGRGAFVEDTLMASDVQEFIKLLKEKLPKQGNVIIIDFVKEIDKLSGGL